MTPRRDLVVERGKQDRVTCVHCGEDLGYLTPRTGPHRQYKHGHMVLNRNVTIRVERAIRVDIFCPHCGTCRSIHVDRFPVIDRIGEPVMLDSA